MCDFLFIAQWSSLSEAWRRRENPSQSVNLSVTSRVLFVVYTVQLSAACDHMCCLYSVYKCTVTTVRVYSAVYTPQAAASLRTSSSPEISPRLPPQSGCSCGWAPILSDNRPECCDNVTPRGDHCDVWHTDTVTPGMWSIDVKSRGCVHSLQVH